MLTITKKERSPSFPFISLRKAVERTEQMLKVHRREAVRLSVLGSTWGYALKSSGLLQTVAALKQFGLIDEDNSGEERKFYLSDLGRRIMSDARPGVREKGLKEAAQMPKLFKEYISRWVPDFPDDSHCRSELELDRGFTADAAITFVKVLRITVKFAGLDAGDDAESPSPGASGGDDEMSEVHVQPIAKVTPSPAPYAADHFFLENDSQPLNQRLRVATNGNVTFVQASLLNRSEIDRLIRILEAHKTLLEDFPVEDPH